MHDQARPRTHRRSRCGLLAIASLLAASCTTVTEEDPSLALSVTLDYLEGVSVRVRVTGPRAAEVGPTIDTLALQRQIEDQIRATGLAVLPVDQIEDPVVGSFALIEFEATVGGCEDGPESTALVSTLRLREVVSPARDPDTIFILDTWSLASPSRPIAGSVIGDIRQDASMLVERFLEDFARANPDASPEEEEETTRASGPPGQAVIAHATFRASRAARD